MIGAMRVAIVARSNARAKWGGDLFVFRTICEGLRALGHGARIVSSVSQVESFDFVFLSNTCVETLTSEQAALSLMGKRYGVIPFHEDALLFSPPASGMYHFLLSCLFEKVEGLMECKLEFLDETPHIVYYHAFAPRNINFVNRGVLSAARLCIANSEREAKTILRDNPQSHVKVVPLSPGLVGEFGLDASDEFLSFTGLSSKSYALQVGRMEKRKNQMGTIVALRDLEIPLVFIATNTHQREYQKACLLAILKWRKAPTFVISQQLAPFEQGPLKILPMSKKKKLPSSMIQSAFFHAGIHVHPAFYELPGYTYFESAYYGVPTVASKWAAIDEYFRDPPLDERIEYVLPYDCPAIEGAVKRQFGKRYPREPLHPAFLRTKEDVAREIVQHILTVV